MNPGSISLWLDNLQQVASPFCALVFSSDYRRKVTAHCHSVRMKNKRSTHYVLNRGPNASKAPREHFVLLVKPWPKFSLAVSAPRKLSFPRFQSLRMDRQVPGPSSSRWHQARGRYLHSLPALHLHSRDGNSPPPETHVLLFLCQCPLPPQLLPSDVSCSPGP